jgi:hypothetical protein
MLTECPHCFTSVLPKADGTCPACLANAGETSGVDANMTKVTLPSGAANLPPVCVCCGTNTKLAIAFDRTAPNPQFTPSGFSIFGLVRFLDRVSGKTVQQVALRIPQCEECASAGKKPRIHHLDFENALATVIVHRSFRQALDASKQQLRQAQQSVQPDRREDAAPG